MLKVTLPYEVDWIISCSPQYLNTWFLMASPKMKILVNYHVSYLLYPPLLHCLIRVRFTKSLRPLFIVWRERLYYIPLKTVKWTLLRMAWKRYSSQFCFTGDLRTHRRCIQRGVEQCVHSKCPHNRNSTRRKVYSLMLRWFVTWICNGI